MIYLTVIAAAKYPFKKKNPHLRDCSIRCFDLTERFATQVLLGRFCGLFSCHFKLPDAEAIRSSLFWPFIPLYCCVVFFLIEIAPANCSPRMMLWALGSCKYEGSNKRVLENVWCSLVCRMSER